MAWAFLTHQVQLQVTETAVDILTPTSYPCHMEGEDDCWVKNQAAACRSSLEETSGVPIVRIPNVRLKAMSDLLEIPVAELGPPKPGSPCRLFV